MHDKAYISITHAKLSFLLLYNPVKLKWPLSREMWVGRHQGQNQEQPPPSYGQPPHNTRYPPPWVSKWSLQSLPLPGRYAQADTMSDINVTPRQIARQIAFLPFCNLVMVANSTQTYLVVKPLLHLCSQFWEMTLDGSKSVPVPPFFFHFLQL